MLDADAVRAYLGNGWAGVEVRALGSVASTNDLAWAWAEAGCAEGTSIFAEEQVQGRGRHGRTWVCPRGRGILVSVVLRPPGGEAGPAHVTALAALAAAEAIEETAGLEAMIRWPNDVTLRGRKAAGVLVECRGQRASPCVVGIGLNVNTRSEEFPEELRERATSLAIEAGRAFEREAVAGALLRRLQARYRDALEGRWEQVAAEWRRRAALLGEAVTVQAEGRDHVGRLVALDPLAGITLELAGGESRAFRAEDATRVVVGGGRGRGRGRGR